MNDRLAEGTRTYLRAVTHADADEFVAASVASRDLHHPWTNPPRDAAEFTSYIDRIRADPAKIGLLFCTSDDDRIAGTLNISNVVYGAFRCGALGYSVFAHAAGQGLMSDALQTVIRYSFGPLGLHRLEANVQPGNARSLALVDRLRFPAGGLLAGLPLHRRRLARPRALGDHHRHGPSPLSRLRALRPQADVRTVPASARAGWIDP